MGKDKKIDTFMSLDKNSTIDFGAPNAFGAHLFRVEIPVSRNESVVIVEDFGYRGNQGGIPREEERVLVKRPVWSSIAEPARREFNTRLKAANVRTGRWHTGANLVDRLLGKELCVLAWAAETANEEQLPVICSKWAALRPEERWWLFSITVAEAGLPQDTQRGWRRALFYALSDGQKTVSGKKRSIRPKQEALFESALFKDLQ
jgi:hypothetical protein